jgi:hypothetical protein
LRFPEHLRGYQWIETRALWRLHHVYVNFDEKDKDVYQAVGINSLMLGPQRTGPCRVLKKAGENAYIVTIPND